MPNSPEEVKKTQQRGSPAAKAWSLRRSEQFGNEVKRLRTAKRLSASDLAQITESLGYPITRSSIARIEGNHRAGKMDVSEVVVLAAALEVAPVLLLFPGLPDGRVEALPGREVDAMNALLWFGGEEGETSHLPANSQPVLNQVRALHGEQVRFSLLRRITMGMNESDAQYQERIEQGEQRIRQLREQIDQLPGSLTDER